MGFFSSGEQATTADNGAIKSIVGQGMTIHGDISFDGKIRVDGNIEGNLTGDYLILSESGNITGDIDANTVVCHGQIEGNLRIDKLFIKKTGIINGRLETADLSVESGGVMNGEIRSQQATAEPPRLVDVSPKPDKPGSPPSLPNVSES